MKTNITLQHNDIDQLARKATAGTLKRIYTASGNDRIRQLQSSLQHDFSIVDNGLNDVISDAYDCYIVAYEYIAEQFTQGLTEQSEISITLKNGVEKVRTVYQWACVKVRQYVYQNKAIECNSKFTYIEDMSKSEGEGGEIALDRELVRMGIYNGIDTYNDYISYTEMLEELNLTLRQSTVVRMRMQGLSVTAIADKLRVSHPAISKTLIQMQGYIIEKFPEMLRQFKESRNGK